MNELQVDQWRWRCILYTKACFVLGCFPVALFWVCVFYSAAEPENLASARSILESIPGMIPGYGRGLAAPFMFFLFVLSLLLIWITERYPRLYIFTLTFCSLVALVIGICFAMIAKFVATTLYFFYFFS